MTDGLKISVKKFSQNMTKPLSIELSKALENELNSRFGNVSNSYTLAAPAILDPRLKKKAFLDNFSFSKVKTRILLDMEQLQTETESSIIQELANPQESKSCTQSNIWETFDSQTANQVYSTLKSASIIEFNQYMLEPLLNRKEDPLQWWKTREKIYPRLAVMAKKHLGAVATSVPSERIFSKTGQIISVRRSSLKAKNVEKLIFLNANYELLE